MLITACLVATLMLPQLFQDAHSKTRPAQMLAGIGSSPERTLAESGTSSSPEGQGEGSNSLKKPVTIYEDDIVKDDPAADCGKSGEVLLVATISVPHTRRAIARVTAYPYPMKPPSEKTRPALFPEEEKQLKGLIMGTGYLGRASPDVPYPPGGWRWQYAMQKAIAESKLSVPHSILEHYPWTNRMLPYVKKYILASNQQEKERIFAYRAAAQDYIDNRVHLEDLSLRRGLHPLELKPMRAPNAPFGAHYKVSLAPAKWWILATHRVPGLKYNWLLPVDLTQEGATRQQVKLTEDNAILIEGGW